MSEAASAGSMQTNGDGGFTLLEMAIVLVIVGLIVGGVLVGRDMIRGTELRKNYGQYEAIVTAINAFKTKFGCIPGDCPNATEFFLEHAGCPDLSGASRASPGVFENDTPSAATCNGDGDNRIDAAKTVFEMTTIWQQLAAAGLIEGQFTGGMLVSGPTLLLAGSNLPAAAVANGYGWFLLDGDESVLFEWLIGISSLALVPTRIGTIMSAESFGTVEGPYTPAEALAYDSKFDDGGATTGRIMQRVSPDGPVYCTDAADETTQSSGNVGAKYLAQNAQYRDKRGCALLHLVPF